MGSFLRYNETLFQFFCNIKNNLNFSEKSEICIFFITIDKFVTKFQLNAYQNVFICVYYILGQLGYIVMSDSEKKSKYSFFEKKIRFTPFFVARTKTTGVAVIASYSVGF